MFTVQAVLHGFTNGVATTVRGRVTSCRKHGKVAFVDINDRTGSIQIIVTADTNIEVPGVGDLVTVSGRLCLSNSGTRSLACHTLTYDARCATAVSTIRDSGRHVARYLELLADKQRFEFFSKTSRFNHVIRSNLYNEGFLEFDTSTLQSRFNAGFARPFTTRVNATNSDAYLRLTSELRLKQLMAAGYGKVFEMGKSFRNEGVDRMHHPEFTQLEVYCAYDDYHGMMSMIETLLRQAAFRIFDSTVLADTQPWPRIDLLAYSREIFGKNFSFSHEAATLHELGRTHIPQGRSLNPESSVPQLYLDLFRKAVFPRFEEPTFLFNFPASVSPLTKRSSLAEDMCEKAALIVHGRRVCDLASEENDPNILEHALMEQSTLNGRVPDPDFLSAVRTGIPPMAGAGLGIERIALLLEYGNFDRPVADAILFPLRS